MDSRLQTAIEEVNGNLPIQVSIVDKAIAQMEPLSREFYSTPEIRALLDDCGRAAADMVLYGEQRFTFFNGEWHSTDSEALPSHMRTPANAEPKSHVRDNPCKCPCRRASAQR